MKTAPFIVVYDIDTTYQITQTVFSQCKGLHEEIKEIMLGMGLKY